MVNRSEILRMNKSKDLFAPNTICLTLKGDKDQLSTKAAIRMFNGLFNNANVYTSYMVDAEDIPISVTNISSFMSDEELTASFNILRNFVLSLNVVLGTSYTLLKVNEVSFLVGAS